MDIVYDIKSDYIKLIHNIFSFLTSIILVIFGLNIKNLMKKSLHSNESIVNYINDTSHIDEYLNDNTDEIYFENKGSGMYDIKINRITNSPKNSLNSFETYYTKRLYLSLIQISN